MSINELSEILSGERARRRGVSVHLKTRGRQRDRSRARSEGPELEPLRDSRASALKRAVDSIRDRSAGSVEKAIVNHESEPC
jgi:hypothetical protein